MRFHVIRDDQRLHMVLDHDGYAADRPIVVADDLSRIEFTLENRTGGAHRTGLTIAGLPDGDYGVTVDGKPVATITGSRTNQQIVLPVSSSPAASVAITKGTLNMSRPRF